MRHWHIVTSLFILSLNAGAGEITELGFQTSDGVQIATNWYHDPALPQSTVIIFSPGLSQYKDSSMMVKLSTALTVLGEVVNLDFRGTGKSSGSFTFGAKEQLDIEPILQWANGRFKKIVLLGVSLGGYTTLRAAAEWPALVDQVLVASPPTSADADFWQGDVMIAGINNWLHPDPLALQDHGNPFFHWGFPLGGKPDARDFAGEVQAPTSFLVGSADLMVPMAMSRKIYKNVKAPKSWLVMQGGLHAEEMYLQNPDLFMKWMNDGLNR